MATPSMQVTLNSTNDTDGYHMKKWAVLAAAICEILIILVGTIGNVFTIIAVLRNRNLQYATNYLIVSLSVADTLVCTILVPMRASQHIAYQYDASIPKTFKEVAGFVGRVNILASISTLVSLSIDRYLALSRPLKYATSIRYSLWKVLAVIATIWSLSIFITSLPKFPGVSDKPFLIFFIVFVLTATLIICVAYYRIFHIIAKNMEKMGQPIIRYSNNFQTRPQKDRSASVASTSKVSCESLSAKNVNSTGNKTSSKVAPESETSRDEARGLLFSREERKAAKTVGLVIAAFILLVYPRIVMILYHFEHEETSSSIVARFWMRVFLYCNSAVNPTFYAYRHKGFRNEFKKMGLQCLGLGRVIRERYGTVMRQEQSSGSSTFYT